MISLPLMDLTPPISLSFDIIGPDEEFHVRMVLGGMFHGDDPLAFWPPS